MRSTDFCRKARLIGSRELGSKISNALLAALLDRFQLFPSVSETVAMQFDTSLHICHAIAESGLGTGPSMKKDLSTSLSNYFSNQFNVGVREFLTLTQPRCSAAA
jgi:hypothetical protein